MKKKVYISLPMNGYEDTIWKRYTDGIKYLHNLPGYEDAEILSPYSIEDYNPDRLITKADNNQTFTYGFYISNDVKMLIDNATDILMTPNWEKSKGCQIEYNVSKIMNINILYQKIND